MRGWEDRQTVRHEQPASLIVCHQLVAPRLIDQLTQYLVSQPLVADTLETKIFVSNKSKIIHQVIRTKVGHITENSKDRIQARASWSWARPHLLKPRQSCWIPTILVNYFIEVRLGWNVGPEVPTNPPTNLPEGLHFSFS